MKRFATLLTVSISMAAIAFADHPMADPDYGNDVGFPYHPGDWVSQTLDTDLEWQECFCTDTPTYDEFSNWPFVPVIVEAFDVLRMTDDLSTDESSYIQNPNLKCWVDGNDQRVIDMSFYFACQSTGEALGYYITPAARTDEMDNPMDFTGLAFIIERDPMTEFTTISVYDAPGNLVASQYLPVFDSNFHLLRVRYYDGTVRVSIYEYLTDVEIIPITAVTPIGDCGYFGFGGFGGEGAYQYIDDVCLAITDDTWETVDAEDVPVAFDLGQNYPNPFNPATTIDFTVPETGYATLKVYNLAGEEVNTLVDGMVERGLNSISFDAGALSTGVYFYTLESAGLLSTKKMVLVK